MKRKSWLDLKPSNRLQNINILISVVGVAISLILSATALRLTYKYGESTAQIGALTKIGGQQQQQIGKLESILNEDRQVKENSNILLGQMKVSNDKLAKQVEILSSEQSINNKLRMFLMMQMKHGLGLLNIT